MKRLQSIKRWISLAHSLVFLSALLMSAAFAASPVRTVDFIAIPVSDIERSVAFYHDVLGFDRVSEDEVAGESYEHLYGVFGMRIHTVRMRLGDEQIQLQEFLAPRGRPLPNDFKSNDRIFQHIAIIVSDMDKAYAKLRQHKVQHASTGPQRLPNWNANAGGIAAFYFKDPDGNHLEILSFPSDKGDPKWHRQSDKLFLGIDHTAIVVADTDTSLKFYRDTLGMRIAGTSENYGTEQEHLNNVFGARLRITSLHAMSGPGVELLEYLTPRTGRPMPVDSQANDAWSWQVVMSADVAVADQVLRAAHATYVSTSLTSSPERLMVRDVDGHILLLQSAK